MTSSTLKKPKVLIWGQTTMQLLPFLYKIPRIYKCNFVLHRKILYHSLAKKQLWLHLSIIDQFHRHFATWYVWAQFKLLDNISISIFIYWFHEIMCFLSMWKKVSGLILDNPPIQVCSLVTFAYYIQISFVLNESSRAHKMTRMVVRQISLF